jgi:hypothetical protein
MLNKKLINQLRRKIIKQNKPNYPVWLYILKLDIYEFLSKFKVFNNVINRWLNLLNKEDYTLIKNLDFTYWQRGSEEVPDGWK